MFGLPLIAEVLLLCALAFALGLAFGAALFRPRHKRTSFLD